ncbi:MAG: tRNA pseudouridine(13) synthase TruD [Methanosarcinaceae archaeon]|nr:tRNA pseudouridine(13) synthase TruD [Methanosarcinaceae archaeon]
MKIPLIEEQIGIDRYSTTVDGVGGVLRQQISDFIVREITNRQEGDDGKHLVIELTKHNWELHHLIRDISRILRISNKRIGFAGTKDKRAITTQKISIYDINEEDIETIHLKDMELSVIGRSNRSVGLGDLYGNEFEITVRDIDLDEDELSTQLESITTTIHANGGVPNFFGIQRFGAFRPITHLVGESLVRGDIEKAAIDYIAKSFQGEPEETQIVRDRVFETREYVEGLKQYPVQLRYERAMMHHLVSNPDDFVGAFGVLSKNLQKMFVHAYQSYIFNKVICTRMYEGLPLDHAVEGDIVCFKNKEGLPDASRTQRVTEENVDGMNNLIRRSRAFVTAPLVGYDTEIASGIPGEIERRVLDELCVPIEGFRLPQMSKLGSRGLRREILLQTDPTYRIGEDELNPGKQKAVLEFSLPKGSYATMVLREYMKVEPSKMS